MWATLVGLRGKFQVDENSRCFANIFMDGSHPPTSGKLGDLIALETTGDPLNHTAPFTLMFDPSLCAMSMHGYIIVCNEKNMTLYFRL